MSVPRSSTLEETWVSPAGGVCGSRHLSASGSVAAAGADAGALAAASATAASSVMRIPRPLPTAQGDTARKGARRRRAQLRPRRVVRCYNSAMAGAEATLHAAWPTVGELTDSLDREIVHVIRPGAPSATGRDVVIVDATDPHSIRADVLLLAVGTPDPVALVERAVEAGSAGIVFRTSDLPREALRRAEEGGLALLCVPPVMPWGQAYSLLRTAAATAGARDSADTAGVPLGDLFALADAIAADLDGPVTVEDPQMRVLA